MIQKNITGSLGSGFSSPISVLNDPLSFEKAIQTRAPSKPQFQKTEEKECSSIKYFTNIIWMTKHTTKK